MVFGLKPRPDPGIVREQLLALQALWHELGAESFCRATIWILRKEAEDHNEADVLSKKFGHWNRRLVPFIWNRMQRQLWADHGQNNIAVKYRQGGLTTWMIICRLLLPCILEPGSSGLLISQTKEYGAKHFDILRRGFRHFMKLDPFDDRKNTLANELHQNLLHIQYSSRHELIFDMLDSRVVVDTAENEEVGQGIPGVNHLACTETSRWPHNPEETMANVTESVSPHGTKDIEATPNGQGGYFYEEWNRAQNGCSIYKPHFFPWPYAEEYTIDDKVERQRYIASVEDMTAEEQNLRERFQLTLGQVAWRRMKMVALRHNFFEKYPEDPVSCFLLIGGQPFFDRVTIRDRLLWTQTRVKPVEVNLFSDDGSCSFIIFTKAIKGRSYILHGDVAQGKQITTSQADFSHFVVIDEQTGAEVARYRNRIPPEDYAYHIKMGAELYGNCLVSVESNPGGGGETVLSTLKNQLSYLNVYQHKKLWRLPGQEPKIIAEPGLPVTTKTRPFILNKLAMMVREAPDLFLDQVFWQEAGSFVRDGKGNPSAAKGCHDDAVMAAAGAHFVRLVQLGQVDPLVLPTEDYQTVSS